MTKPITKELKQYLDDTKGETVTFTEDYEMSPLELRESESICLKCFKAFEIVNNIPEKWCQVCREPKIVTYRVRFYYEPGMLFALGMGQQFQGVHARRVFDSESTEENGEKWDIEVPEDQAERFAVMLGHWQGVRVQQWARLEEIPEDWK